MVVAGVLQEAGDAHPRAHTRSQVWVEYNIIRHTSTSIALLHLCQGYHGNYILLYCHSKWWGDGKVGAWFIYVRDWVGDQGMDITFFSIFSSVFVLLLIVLSWMVHDSLLGLFHFSFFAFFVFCSFFFYNNDYTQSKNKLTRHTTELPLQYSV